MNAPEQGRAASRRATGVAGITAAVLVIGGLTLIGSLPDSQASFDEYERFFYNHHDRILIGSCFAALGLALTLCFLTGLGAALRDGPEAGPELATIGLVAGAARIAVLYGASAALLAPAYRFGISDPSVPRTLADVSSLATVLAAYPTVISTGAFGVAMLRSRAFASWLGWLTLLVAVANLMGASMFTQSGALAPSGVVSLRVMPLVYYSWVVVVSLALLAPVRAGARSTPAA